MKHQSPNFWEPALGPSLAPSFIQLHINRLDKHQINLVAQYS
jgi:hypothetical protein